MNRARQEMGKQEERDSANEQWDRSRKLLLRSQSEFGRCLENGAQNKAVKK